MGNLDGTKPLPEPMPIEKVCITNAMEVLSMSSVTWDYIHAQIIIHLHP